MSSVFKSMLNLLYNRFGFGGKKGWGETERGNVQ